MERPTQTPKTVHLSPPLHHKLKAAALSRSISVQQLLAEIVTEWSKRPKRESRSMTQSQRLTAQLAALTRRAKAGAFKIAPPPQREAATGKVTYQPMTKGVVK